MEESFVDPTEFVHDEQQLGDAENDEEDEDGYGGASELGLATEDLKRPDTVNLIKQVNTNYSSLTTTTKTGLILEQLQEEASCTTLCTAMPPSQEDLLHLRASNNVPSGTPNSCATQLSSYNPNPNPDHNHSHNHSPSFLKQQISLFNNNINSTTHTTTAFVSAFSDHHSAQSQLSEDGSDMSSHPANSHLISAKPAGHISSSSSPLQFSPLLYNTEFGQAAQTVQLGYGSPGALTHQTSPGDHPHHHHSSELELHKPSGLSIDIDGAKSDRVNTGGAAGCVSDIHSGRFKLWGNTASNSIEQDRGSILYQAPLLHSTEIEQGSTSTANNTNEDHHSHHHHQLLMQGAAAVRAQPTQMTENFMSLSNHHPHQQQLYGNYAAAKPAQGMGFYTDQMDILRVAQPGTAGNRGGAELQQDGSEIYEAEAVDAAALMRGTNAIAAETGYGNDRAAMAAVAQAHGYGVATGAGGADGHNQQAATQQFAIDWGIGNSTSAHELSLMPRAEISSHHHHSHHHHPQQQHVLSSLQPSSRDSSLQASSLHDNRPLIPFNGLNMMSGQQCTNNNSNNNSVAAAALWPQKLAMESSSAASIHGQLNQVGQQQQFHDQLEHYRVAGGGTAEAAARGFLIQDQSAAAQLQGAAGPAGALSLFLPSPAAAQQQHYRTEQMSVGLQDSCRYSRSGSLSALRNSRYLKAAQQLLDEFCNVGRDVVPVSKPTSGAMATSPGAGRTTPGATNNPSPWVQDHMSNPSVADHSVASTNPADSITDHLSGLQQQQQPSSSAGANRGQTAPSSTSPGSADHSFPHGVSAKQLPPDERYQLQMRKLRLIGMVEELDRRYQEYRDKMQLIITSFESATGLGAAAPYTALARRVISKQFRGLRDAISDHIHRVCKALGEEASSVPILNKGETPRLRILDQRLRHQRALQQIGMFQQQQVWRPQRGLPERSVSVLRAWLFEHFLHPYPKDSEKLMLARLTGLTRNQVSNWFINARVRLWKPMVEQMYLEETKELELMNESGGNAAGNNNNNTNNSNSSNSNNSTGQPNMGATTTAAPSTPQYTSSAAGLGMKDAAAGSGGLHGAINSYNYNIQMHSDTRSPNESLGAFFKQAGYGGMSDSGRIDHDPGSAASDHDQQMHRLQLMQAAAAQSRYDTAGSIHQQHANSMMIKELGLQQQVSLQPYGTHHDASGQFQLMAQMQQHQHQMESQLNFIQQQPSGGYNNSNFHSGRSGVSLTLELQNSASSADHQNSTINFHRLQQAAAGSLYSNNSSSPTNTTSQLYGRSIRF